MNFGRHWKCPNQIVCIKTACAAYHEYWQHSCDWTHRWFAERKALHWICSRNIMGKRKQAVGSTPRASDSQLGTMQQIDVICCSVFLLGAAAAEWQRATFGFAHTRPWVFSAWWTSTLRVKGLSYKSGRMALEVKTCTQASRKRTGKTAGLQKLSENLGVLPAEMIFPNDPLLGDSGKTYRPPLRIWQVDTSEPPT